MNSVAGLLGHVSSVQSLPPAAFVWAVAAVAGGLIGSEWEFVGWLRSRFAVSLQRCG
jgi:hypothetical protein